MKVSIIIPCKEINKDTKKCIDECLKLEYDDFEILVLPDKKPKIKLSSKKVRIITTVGTPSLKRNLAMEKAKGDFYAFIDSDAYPRRDWLKNAIKYFQDSDIGIAGGPNLIPENAGFWEKISDCVLSNFWASGFAFVRYKTTRNQFVKELPSCNYIARKSASEEFLQDYLTAEDSKFCFDCLKKGYKVLYAKDVVVYHHRRNSLSRHLKQVFIYGRDIAWLTKKDFSLDKLYFSINSIGVLGFILGIILSFFSFPVRLIFLYLLFLYILIMLVVSIKENLKTSFFVFITTITTHFSYGLGWLYGIIKSKV